MDNGKPSLRSRGARPAKTPARRRGTIASEANLRARVELARAMGDAADERRSADVLADLLAARDVELDFAVELAFRSLAAHDDPARRSLLATWLEVLGEPGLAASELRKLPRSASVLGRVGVLHARAGDAVGAQEALVEAAEADPADPLPLELLGAVAAWATAMHGGHGSSLDVEGFPGPRAGAEAYVGAAGRKAAARDVEGELEDLLRAFELDRTSPLAAHALVAAWGVRGRPAAADHVLRLHAAAAGNPAIHAERRATALGLGDVGTALGAALDEGLDRTYAGPEADAFDDLLARASAWEPLAVRLEIRAERERGKEASVRWAELGRLLAGPLASNDRALESLARAVAADATNGEAIATLKSLGAKVGDDHWLLEGLLRAALDGAALGGGEEIPARTAAARELATIGETRNDVALTAWAYRTMADLDPSDERARAAASRLEGELTAREGELARARAALENAVDRAGALAEAVRAARSLPDFSRELAGYLLELAAIEVRDGEVEPLPLSVRDPAWERPAAEPAESVFAEALRVAERVGDFAGVAKLAQAWLDARGSNVRIRGVLARALRRRGDPVGAADAARPLAKESATRWTCSVAWVAAAIAEDDATRGRALAAFAYACAPGIGATLAAVASEILEGCGAVDEARAAAEQARRTDPKNVRALVALARLARPEEGRPAQAAIERAMEATGPSAPACARLAEHLAAAGDLRGAVAWARRVVTLKPGDPVAVKVLVDRAMEAGDAVALAEALEWLAPQPQPSREMAALVAPALEALAALDAPRAATIARRILDVLGPRQAQLRAAIAKVASVDPRLRALVGERWIAAGAPAAERGPMLLELAGAWAEVGDASAEVHSLARAAREGVDLTAKHGRIEALVVQDKSPDAELWWLEACAELALDEGRSANAADAFRELGAAFWDMADDRPRAVQAWLRGAHCDSVHGYDTLRQDLAAFADVQYAVDCLAELVDREGDRVRSGVIATQAARAALDVGAFSRALGLAKAALERDPGKADALVTAESACKALARVPEMSPIYDGVARRARGRFGRRAAHHRASRYFESGGAAMLALKHAAQAFIAVPSEGTTLALLQRTAVKANRPGVAVRTLEHVAEGARHQSIRGGWLLRAATMTARDLEGTRQKLELLLKASVSQPTPGTFAMLAVAARELTALAPDDSAAVALRLERSGDQLAKILEGPDGARIAIEFVEMAMTLFYDGAWGWRALEQAIGADADVDEYVRLVPHAATFARAQGAAAASDRVMAQIDKPYANVGHALLRLVGAIARAMNDGARRAKVLARAAEKESDDDALVVEADEAVFAHDDAALAERFAKRVPADRRTEALRAAAQRAIGEGRAHDAVRMLERATELAEPGLREEIATEIEAALVAAGRGEEAMERGLAGGGIAASERAGRLAELARFRSERGDLAGAVDALAQAATIEPTSERWEATEKAAESAGNDDRRVDALVRLIALAREGNDRDRLRAVLQRLARVEGARGGIVAAERAWREVLVTDPHDGEADVAIEALLVARSSYEELSNHLAARAHRLSESKVSEDRDKLRAVRLRRAAILEQRLGRLEDACLELEQLLAENPGHPSALRWLADLYERAGEPQKALPALEVLFIAANEELEYVNLGVRRVRALLASGDLARARRSTTDLHARAPAVIAVAEVRVEVARAAQDPQELGDALAELAKISVDEPRVRSEMLVEAAQAAARAGKSDASLARAKEAARLAPDLAATQLFARGLEYRVRGAGDADDARLTVASLERLVTGNGSSRNSLEPEDIALRAFLLAEAEDLLGTGGEATLRAAFAEAGPQPLVALGLAERAAKGGRHEEAYRFFTAAVYGNLLGLRRHGRVAMAAAESAARAGDADATQRFLNEAAKDPDTRVEALRRVARLAISKEDTAKAKAVLRSLAEGLSGAQRSEILAELGRALLESSNPAERIEGDRTFREAIEHAPHPLSTELEAELETFRVRAPISAAPETPPAGARPTPPHGTAWSDPPRRAALMEIARPVLPGEERRRLSVELPGIPKIPPAPLPLTIDPEEDPVQSIRHPLESSPPPKHDTGEVETPRVPPVVPNEVPPEEETTKKILDPESESTPEPGPLPSGPPEEGSFSQEETVPIHVPVRVSEVPTTTAGKVAKARARLLYGSREEAERLLGEALREGSVDAADLLDGLFKDEPARRGALLKVRRQAVELNPGNLLRLAALRDVAKADQNTNYVRAIEHVIRAFDPTQAPHLPPPLVVQNAQPGMLNLLSRHSHEPAGEAFGVVWEGAPTMFAKGQPVASVNGLERVVPGPTTPVSALYELALRLLDPPRFPLFHRRTTTLGRPRKTDQGTELPFEEGAPFAVSVTLLATPTAILEGDGREDSAELRWMLGVALSSVLPQNALVAGLGRPEARSLWQVILGAFGPPGLVTVERGDAQLADMLWQTLAPKTQRRLRELLATTDLTPFELVLERSKQSARRIGMFLTGDFGHAARKVIADYPQASAAELERPGGLEKLCTQLPSLADLLRLAVRPEYADARWHLPTPASQRLSSGRLPLL